MKRLALITLTICATLLAFFLLWVFRPALGLFGGSLAISAALRPLVQRLEARGISRGLAILIWYVLILAGLVVGVLIYGLGITTEVSLVAEQLPKFYTSLVEAWARSDSPFQQAIARGMPEFDGLVQSITTGSGLLLVGGTVAGLVGDLVGDLVFLSAALCLAYYWLIEVTHFERLWLSLLPVGARVRARTIWRTTEGAVGAYVRATVVAIALAALLLLVLYTLIGLPFRTWLALIGGFGQLVPRLGPIVGLLPALGVALATSPLEAILVLVGGSSIQILTHKLAVRTMEIEALKVNPLLQVLLLLALAELGGLGAMVFAPPLAALIQVLYVNILTTDRRPQESAFDQLCERLEALQLGSDRTSKELASTLQRSADLIAQARSLIGGGRAYDHPPGDPPLRP